LLDAKLLVQFVASACKNHSWWERRPDKITVSMAIEINHSQDSVQPVRASD